MSTMAQQLPYQNCEICDTVLSQNFVKTVNIFTFYDVEFSSICKKCCEDKFAECWTCHRIASTYLTRERYVEYFGEDYLVQDCVYCVPDESDDESDYESDEEFGGDYHTIEVSVYDRA